MHFSIAVITKGKPTETEISELMAPFRENNMGDVPEEYLEFCPIDDDELQHYKDQYEDATVKKKGQVCNAKDTMSFREYMEDEKGYVYDEETEQYGYYTNPNSHWDWYQIGGRWCANLTVPFNCDCIIGEDAWGDALIPYKCDDSRIKKCDGARIKKCDGARIKNLVFPNTEEEKEKAARFWELYIDGDTPRNEEEKKILEDHGLYAKEYFLTQYQTKENYVHCMSSFYLY